MTPDAQGCRKGDLATVSLPPAWRPTADIHRCAPTRARSRQRNAHRPPVRPRNRRLSLCRQAGQLAQAELRAPPGPSRLPRLGSACGPTGEPPPLPRQSWALQERCADVFVSKEIVAGELQAVLCALHVAEPSSAECHGQPPEKGRWPERRSGRRTQCAKRKSCTAAIVAAGASSISQWPAFGTTSSCTFVAALRMTTATLAPKAFAAPMASTGIASFVSIALRLSASSFWPIARNWANAECIAPGLA